MCIYNKNKLSLIQFHFYNLDQVRRKCFNSMRLRLRFSILYVRFISIRDPPTFLEPTNIDQLNIDL